MAKWSEQLVELVQVRGAELNRYGFLLCGNRSGGADLLQDALVRVFTHPKAGWTIQDLERYVRRAMLNRYLDQYRRQRRLRLLLPRLSGGPQTEVAPDHSEGIEQRLDLQGALNKLTPRQRACVVLRFYEDLSVGEVAHRMGLSDGTVKRYLSDAAARMAQFLEHPAHVSTRGN